MILEGLLTPKTAPDPVCKAIVGVHLEGGLIQGIYGMHEYEVRKV